MKITKKLMALMLALALSVCAVPTVWADEIEQQPEGSYSDHGVSDGEPQTGEKNESNGTEEEIKQDDKIISDGDDGGIMPFSLLPLTRIEKSVTIDRTGGIPEGLEYNSRYALYAREALSQALAEDGVISASGVYSGTIMYSFNDDDYHPVGWNDIIEPHYNIYRIYFILSDDQLNIDNKFYAINISFKFMEDYFELKAFDKNKQEITIHDAYSNYSGNGIWNASSWNTYGNIIYSEYGLVNYDLYFQIALSNNLNKNNIEFYKGIIRDESALDNAVNITPYIIYDGKSEPYKMTRESYWAFWNSNITAVVNGTNGVKNFYPINIVFSHVGSSMSLTARCNSASYIVAGLYEEPNGRYPLSFSEKIYIANDFSELKNVYVSAYYRDYGDDNAQNHSNYIAERDSSKIRKACFGNDINGTDIKDSLFGYGTPVNLSQFPETTAYLIDGTPVRIKSVVVTAENIYNISFGANAYVAIIESSGEEILSDDTYFSIYRAETDDGNNGTTFLSSYKLPSTDDSYYKNGYQTLFVLDGGNPVADGTVIYPVFSSDSGVNVYANGYQGIQKSGESPITFESGKAIQYSAASESGTHLKNYWVTFVTQQSGAKLFVNAVNNPDHFSSSGIPQREVFLDSINNYSHDIFFANIGDAELTGINVLLSGDAQGVKLDDYWTVVDGSVKKLAAFTKTSNSDNIAKVRLVPIDEDYFGEVSGTLTISSANGGSVDIALTGIAGIPKITTDELYDGVKYVPYSSVIMTNNMYGSNAMQFSISGGELPDGIELRPNGELYGIPMETGEFTFTVKAVYNGKKQDNGLPYTCTRSYTIVIEDNTDENVDAANSDIQGHLLVERVSKYITVYYAGSAENPTVDRIVIDNDLFWSEGPLSELQAFYINGIKLTEGSDYDAEEGSTKITVRAQTFEHIGVTDNTVPHTLAAEFRTSDTNELKRSAQNVYIDYISNGGNGGNGGNSGNGGNGGNGGNSENSAGVSNTGKVNDKGSVTTVIRVVDADGNAVSGLSMELHSVPKYAKTDENGIAKFDSVDFGRHTLYIKRASDGKNVSKNFSMLSGQSTEMIENVIRASSGDTVYMTVQYDGSSIEILSVAEDVSSSAGVCSDGNIFMMNIYKNIFSKRTLYAVLLLIAAIAVPFIKKIKS